MHVYRYTGWSKVSSVKILPQLVHTLKKLFIYLAELGLSWGTWELWSSLQPVGSLAVACELQLRHVGSSSLTRDWTWPPALGATGPPGNSLCTLWRAESLFPIALDLLPNVSPAVFQSQMFWRLIFLEQEVHSLWAREPKVGLGPSCFWERPSMIVVFLVSCPPRCVGPDYIASPFLLPVSFWVLLDVFSC